MESGKLWGGRFSDDISPNFHNYNKSIDIDKQLWREEIMCSYAYARALFNAGLLSASEIEQFLHGYKQIWNEWLEHKFIISSQDEDIHTAIERRLKEFIGDVASKVHTGRSRNELISADVRLWLRAQYHHLRLLLLDFIRVFITRAKSEIDILMPGYTHMQRAQVVRWSHWLLSYAWAMQRDVERLDDWIKRTNKLPLGCGAIAGNPFPIDRKLLAKELGFQNITENSMDSSGDRDFVVEIMFWSSLTSLHLSRWAEDLIIYSTQEFNFVTLADAYSTGSSLMPQKKNPDSLELIRGQAGTIYGFLTSLAMTMKGLPSTYNKDLQEDKSLLFKSIELISSQLLIAANVMSTLKVNTAKCYQALTTDMLATDVAYYLIRKQVPFREAHSIAGNCVRLAENKNCTLSQLKLDDFRSISCKFEDDIMKTWDYEASVEQYNNIGGTSRNAILYQIYSLENWLSAENKIIADVNEIFQIISN